MENIFLHCALLNGLVVFHPFYKMSAFIFQIKRSCQSDGCQYWKGQPGVMFFFFLLQVSHISFLYCSVIDWSYWDTFLSCQRVAAEELNAAGVRGEDVVDGAACVSVQNGSSPPPPERVGAVRTLLQLDMVQHGVTSMSQKSQRACQLLN